MDYKHLLFDNAASIGIGKILARQTDQKHGGFILAYHQINAHLFRSHIDIFKPSQIISLDEIVQRKKAGKTTKGLYAITVDDCYQSTLPDLCSHCSDKQIPITFFAPIDFLKGKPLPGMLLKNIIQYIPGQRIKTNEGETDFASPDHVNALYKRLHNLIYTEKEIIYMDEIHQIIRQLIDNKTVSEELIFQYDQPVSIDFIAKQSKNELLSFQSHSITHQPVIALSENELTKELTESKEILESITNTKVNHFCYPYGGIQNIGTNAQKIVAKHYDSAVTMIKGRLDSAKDPFMLPRIDLYNKDSKGRALLKSIKK